MFYLITHWYYKNWAITGDWTSVYGGGEADILDLTLLGGTRV